MTSEEIKKKVLFITPRHAFTYNDIKENGYQITYPYIGDCSVILRVLREIHFRWKLPFRNIWYCRQKLSGIEVLFLVCGNRHGEQAAHFYQPWASW